ncbi:conserved phage C-terminal domain-containing protein [Streptococcus parasanguinis]|uniref:conserved phage C-terminal domain-containing protein n=1 Tax=Streptococcus parasanguinis TaxID=1318 RepID=UPI0019126D17|nr:conserved phage C-terminal domain-containing protein [Streptococcus parasanguinis]MBK5032411.1 conserved phage C-terminal domain-containing protein [Streptococcus parasanguinis]MBK5174322.1 conserved phage C-terminal domain-containing protein [Streptococcus parasanguinis]DAY12727.1 MAG TPA: replication initiator protein [Caudoviricetes sp.]
MIKKSEVAGFLAFFKFPKPFIYDEKYKKLSNNAKLMYMLLFGRLELSIKNGWHDRKGDVFQYYTNEQLMIDLNSSEKTIIKVKKELREVGLLEEVRQGNNLPNRIYISQVDGAVENTVLELEKVQHGAVENTVLELEKVQTNKIDINDTDNNNIKSICQEVITYLNQVTNKNFNKNTASHHKYIKARLKEGYELKDFKHVVNVMAATWMGTDYERYLQPQTLFGNKFDSYLNRSIPKNIRSFASAVDERLGF